MVRSGSGPTSEDYLRAAQELYPELVDFKIASGGGEVVAKNALKQTVTIRVELIDALMSSPSRPTPSKPAPKPDAE